MSTAPHSGRATPQMYRKKPVVIEAIQYRGTYSDEIKAFFGDVLHEFDGSVGIRISTLEGVMIADQFDWIIKGVKGEFYPCKPDIFAATYEPVDAPPEGATAPTPDPSLVVTKSADGAALEGES